jgi:hypothetical protein
MKYKVGLEITNTFWIEADTPEQASEKMLALGVWEMLDCAEYTVARIDDEDGGEIYHA